MKALTFQRNEYPGVTFEIRTKYFVAAMLRDTDDPSSVEDLANALAENPDAWSQLCLAMGRKLPNNGWNRLLDEDSMVTVDEGNTYLFAIELSDGRWEYFSDAIIWDSETAPQWSEGQHGWDISDAIWYQEILDPPGKAAPDVKG